MGKLTIVTKPVGEWKDSEVAKLEQLLGGTAMRRLALPESLAFFPCVMLEQHGEDCVREAVALNFPDLVVELRAV
jgi:hypothetical protein